jgi:sRNA-binding carbon storage regulator CsrA
MIAPSPSTGLKMRRRLEQALLFDLPDNQVIEVKVVQGGPVRVYLETPRHVRIRRRDEPSTDGGRSGLVLDRRKGESIVLWLSSREVIRIKVEQGHGRLLVCAPAWVQISRIEREKVKRKDRGPLAAYIQKDSHETTPQTT